jgi:Na+/H+-dicarboxylate symporter
VKGFLEKMGGRLLAFDEIIGEMLILSVFGFPVEILPLLAAISVIIDPLATLLNATGDNVAAMMVARLTAGEEWQTEPEGAGP